MGYCEEELGMEAFSLRDRVALITGGGRGIGEGVARAFVEAGAIVALVARTAAEVEAVASDIRAGGGKAIAITADVTDLDQLASLVERTVAEFGGLDILVNNAGGEISPQFLDTRPKHLQDAFHFNVVVPFELSRHAVPHLLERPGASILNMCSDIVGVQTRGSLAHHTGKAAEAQLTLSMAADLGPKIRVNAILPAQVETPKLQEFMDVKSPHLREVLKKKTRMRRNATPQDIGYAAVYLSSPAASWVTGSLFRMNGGAVNELGTSFPDL
jgi:7-alpha-hydroxysteroid dehydrogenase